MEDRVKARLMTFIVERLDVDLCEIDEGTYFTSDLGLDSIRALELVCEVEEQFHCQIPDIKIKSIATVGDLLTFLRQNEASESV